MTAPAYPINVFWSDEDEAWVADVPDVAFCSALGGTPHEAVAEVEVAVAAWLEVAKSSGRQVPQPSRLIGFQRGGDSGRVTQARTKVLQA